MKSPNRSPSKDNPSPSGRAPPAGPAASGRRTVAAVLPGTPGSPAVRQLSVPRDGRVVIPADFRDALGLREGGTVVAELRDGALVIETMAARLRRIRDLVRASDRGTGSVVEEFLAGKQTEAERE